MKPILEVRGISKKFKIQHEQQSYLSLRDSFSNLFTKNKSVEEFWALKDVSFDVYPGDSVGIIGRNGAGKSTLLKILSKITPPSSGKIISRGRIASLLEVGTGFHPELSGRENIYLNGSILGLKRAEINKQFDAIVDFSGVEKFLDTPLKHYSSGMQLRLAFAVAAHLEPEILIIDEVLAVGDAEFQKKCMGKMNEVSKSGRTILFVSHNMAAMQNLCTKGILLNDGTIKSNDTIDIVSNVYLQEFIKVNKTAKWQDGKFPGNDVIKWLNVRAYNKKGESDCVFYTPNEIILSFEFELKSIGHKRFDLTYHLTDENGTLILVGTTVDYDVDIEIGKNKFVTSIPGNILNFGTYTISRLLAVADKGRVIHEIKDCISFEIFVLAKEDSFGWAGKKEGVLNIHDLKWAIND